MSRQALGDSQSFHTNAPEGATYFAVLGPLQVTRGQGLVALPGSKERTLLALLIARANHVVSVDELIEGLWGDDVPPTAEKSLQAHVVRLRDALEPDRPRGNPGRLIYTIEPGYVLACEPSSIDAVTFERLVYDGHASLRSGSSAAAAELLTAAVSLWRGRPYGQFESTALESARTRLLAIERTAREDLGQALLDLGRHSELIPDLEQQLASNPFGERAWAQLMLALYRAGRAAEALAAFGRARSILADELGIEPGLELQELQRQILEHDPALNPGAA